MLDLVDARESKPVAQMGRRGVQRNGHSYLDNVARSGTRSGKCLADIFVRNRGLFLDCAWVVGPGGVAPGHPSKCDESGRWEERGNGDLVVRRRRRPHPFRVEGARLCRVDVARHVDGTRIISISFLIRPEALRWWVEFYADTIFYGRNAPSLRIGLDYATPTVQAETPGFHWRWAALNPPLQ